MDQPQQNAPDTLPANFFSTSSSPAQNSAPDTLPANFFSNTQQATQQNPPAPQTTVPNSMHLGGDPTTLSGGLHNIAAGINSVGAGIGDSVLDTMNGAASILHLPHATLEARQKELEQQNSENPTLNTIGRGAESIAEFLLGDEALKGLSMADKYAQVAKTMKMAEQSPRMMKALQIGADATRMGTVQGVQTGIKTGGDVGAAVHSGLAGAAVGGALGGVGAALGKGAEAIGSAGKKVQELGDAAGSAAPKAEISSQLADKINSSEDLLKSNYGEKLKDFVARTEGTTVPYANSPFHKAVQDILGKGESEATPFDEALRKSRPGSARVNQTLEDLDALGKPPEPEEPETWVDNNGVKHTEPVQKVDEPEPVNMDMKTLLGQRALLGERLRQIKGVSSEDLADKQVYGKLMDGVDDTIDTLVGKAKDPEVADEYQDLRDNYKQHVNLYQDPVVKAITNPKGAPDDAARAFVGLVNKSGLPQAGKVQQSLNTLQKVLDPLGKEGDKPLKDFGSQVFHTILSDAVPKTVDGAPSGEFNASKFMDTWGRIDPATKEKLFGIGNLAKNAEGPQTLLNSLTQDANDVKNIQRLTRVGLLVGSGSPLHVAGIGVLGTLALLNENAGVQAGRNMLDFIANHPAVWKTFRGVGQATESPATQAIGEGIQKVATNAAGRTTEPDNK